MIRKIINFLKGQPEWYGVENPTLKEKCPCCDYITLPERNYYLICPICFWEDEGLDLDEIDEPSGANHGITLREGRKNFQEFGASKKENIKYVISEKERENYEYRPHKDDL